MTLAGRSSVQVYPFGPRFLLFTVRNTVVNLELCVQSSEVTVTSVSPTPFVSHRGILSTNQRLSQRAVQMISRERVL